LPALSLTLPLPESRVIINPSSVRATLDVRAADVQGLIDFVPITIDATPAFLATYNVVLTTDSVANIHVTGPQQQIELLKNKLYPAEAILKVSRDDFGREEPKRLKYDLGEGVKVAPEDANKTVEFKLVKRDSGGG
jgi:hypothetical protein